MPEATKTPPSHADVLSRIPSSPETTPPVENEDPNAGAPPAQTAQPGQPATLPEVKTEPAASFNPDEISDEQFLALYEKKLGKKANSLDDLKPAPKQPTKEELEEAETRLRTEALEWAFGTEKLTREKYDKAIAERARNKREIALTLFSEEMKAGDKNLTDDECEELFADYYSETEPEDSWKRKKGQAAIEKVAENYLAQYAEVDKITDEYKSFKEQTSKRTSYNAAVKDAAKNLPKELTFELPYKSVDGSEVKIDLKVPVDEKLLAGITKALTQPGMEGFFGDNPKPEHIANAIQSDLQNKMLPEILAKLLTTAGEKIETDILAKLKNARGSQGPLGSGQQRENDKTPPDHSSVLSRIK